MLSFNAPRLLFALDSVHEPQRYTLDVPKRRKHYLSLRASSFELRVLSFETLRLCESECF